MEAMTILAIDPANACGWAENRTPSSGTHTFGFHPDQVLGARVDAMVEFLKMHASVRQWGAIYYEAPFIRGAAATASAWALTCGIEWYAHSTRTPVYPVHVMTLKKHATGDALAQKDDMIMAAMDAFPTVKIIDDNHADALWLLDYALNHQASYEEEP